MFAVDSIPAIFAVTQEPFLVYTSNVFAILGLRSLYFLLADVIGRFHFLKLGLAAVLGFVGLKMLAADIFKIPIAISLGVIAIMLGASMVASRMFPKEVEKALDLVKSNGWTIVSMKDDWRNVFAPYLPLRLRRNRKEKCRTDTRSRYRRRRRE